MSLFRGTIRPPAILSDEAIERYLVAMRAEITLDPLFRRRLRGQVMNQYVAAREGIGAAAVPRRRMGTLGRAVLYASFTLAVSATSVLAASQEALPGDLLYPLKRQVERLRVQVLPAHLQDDLAVYELAERIDELAALAERGDVARVAALAAVVEQDYLELLEATSDVAGSSDRLLVLAGLMERLPEPAQAALERVQERLAAQDARHDAANGTSTDRPEPGAASGGAAAGAGGVPSASAEATAVPAPTPEPTPEATKTQKPKPTPPPQPDPTPPPQPDPTPRGPGSPSADTSDH
jgi:hypothetical protein